MGGELPAAQDPFKVDRELTSLRRDHPGWTIGTCPGPGRRRRFEAVRPDGDPCAVITDDAGEMHQILDVALA
jgi:hypothetical protein